MNIIIDQYFSLPNRKNASFLRKEYKTNLLPILNAEIEDSAWEEEKIIKSIVINYREEYYLIKVDEELIKDEQELAEKIKMFKLHEWKDSNEITVKDKIRKN